MSSTFTPHPADQIAVGLVLAEIRAVTSGFRSREPLEDIQTLIESWEGEPAELIECIAGFAGAFAVVAAQRQRRDPEAYVRDLALSLAEEGGGPS